MGVVPPRLDFGLLLLGNKETRKVRITNRGVAPLVLTDFKTSKPQFISQKEFTILDPGEQGDIAVSFQPDDTGELPGALILSFDAIRGLFFSEDWTGRVLFGEGRAGFGLGVGTLVLTMNVILLGGYTFGCHSLRHLIGGRFNIFSRNPTRKVAYDCVSCLNRSHMLWAWCSLFWVGFTDFYIRACSMGIFTDLRIF